LPNAAPLSFTGNSIRIRTGETINVNGTLAASDKVELISDDGNIVITGVIAGRDASGLKRLIVEANGTGTVTEVLADPVTGLPTSNAIEVPAGNIYLRQSTAQPGGGQGSLVTATELVRLHAARQIVGQTNLGIDVSGPAGTVDLSVGTDLTLSAGTTIKADGRVSLASTGGDLRVDGTIQGHSTAFTARPLPTR